MKPKHIETYVDGLHKTLDSKLFFMKHLPENFFKNKVVIDLGCGDGSVLKHIKEHTNITHNDNTVLIAIDNNPEILEYAKNNLGDDCIYFSSLDQLISSTIVQEVRKAHLPIVMICESLLHEVGLMIQVQISDFVEKYCDYLILRDMCITDTDNTREKLSPKDKNHVYSNVIRYSNQSHLSDFIDRYGFSLFHLIHYLLKYTYVENWKTEVEENYGSVNWNIFQYLVDNAKEVIYDNSYVQEWRRNKVLEDFNVDLNKFCNSTHRELVIKLN